MAEIIESGRGTPDSELAAFWSEHLTSFSPDYYLLPDGSVLSVQFGDGVIYSDRNSAREHIISIRESTVDHPEESPRHILDGIFPCDASFPDHVETLIAELAERLLIDPARLNRTLGSAAIVDSAIMRLGGSQLLFAELFPHAVAYIGEVIIHRTGWQWEMIESPVAAGVWEPYLQMNNGQRVKFHHMLYKAAHEENIVDCCGVARHIISFHGEIPIQAGE